MTRRSKIWLVVAVLFNLVNLGGAVIAALQGEVLHACGHVLLLIPGVYVMRRVLATRNAGSTSRRSESVMSAQSGELPDRLTRLEQSIDAVAIEVERVGEGQRFMTQVFAEGGIPRAPGQVPAEPIDIEAKEPPRTGRPSPESPEGE
jgi:hypothetical protein